MKQHTRKFIEHIDTPLCILECFLSPPSSYISKLILPPPKYVPTPSNFSIQFKLHTSIVIRKQSTS